MLLSDIEYWNSMFIKSNKWHTKKSINNNINEMKIID